MKNILTITATFLLLFHAIPSLLDEAAIAADETQVNIPIISLSPDVQVGRVIHGNLQRDYKHELN